MSDDAHAFVIYGERPPRRRMIETVPMQALTHAFLLVYAGLFPIVNPIGSAPFFLRLTRCLGDGKRHELSRRVALGSFILLLASLFVGSHVLDFFGITLPVVRIAGGLVVVALGWKMLNDEDESGEKLVQNEVSAVADSFYPLTMPLTVGPGSISVAITLGSQRPTAPSLTDLALIGGGAVLGLIAIAATIFVCYRFADRVVRWLGPSGTNVLTRLSAFILLCIGIQIAWSGTAVLLGLGER
jgi:multiple antibiotic resistance protein